MAQNPNVEQHAAIALNTDIGKAPIEGQALSDILKQCTDALIKRLGVMSARIWLLDDDHSTLALHAASGCAPHLNTPPNRIPLDQSHLERVVRDKKPMLSNSLQEDMGLPEIAKALNGGVSTVAKKVKQFGLKKEPE